jgi:hypothetical protein
MQISLAYAAFIIGFLNLGHCLPTDASSQYIDGVVYTTSWNEDGTAVISRPITEHPDAKIIVRSANRTELQSTRVKPRWVEGVTCNPDTDVDHSTCDQIVTIWRNLLKLTPWSLPGHDVTHVSVGNVNVYYCVESSGYTGTLSLSDFNYALGRMDSACHAYASSYYHWNSPASVSSNNSQTTLQYMMVTDTPIAW